jgi:DNA-binding PadR family transcriptional regulator
MALPTPDETILGLLWSGRAKHGYQLIDIFRDPEQLGLVWNLSASQIYAVLKRIEQNEWVAGDTVDVPNAPPRTEYCVTEQGYARLQEWLHDAAPSPSIRRVRVDLLSRLYVAALLGLPTADIVARQRATCQAQLDELIASQVATTAPFSQSVLQLGIGQLRAVLVWMDTQG